MVRARRAPSRVSFGQVHQSPRSPPPSSVPEPGDGDAPAVDGGDEGGVGGGRQAFPASEHAAIGAVRRQDREAVAVGHGRQLGALGEMQGQVAAQEQRCGEPAPGRHEQRAAGGRGGNRGGDRRAVVVGVLASTEAGDVDEAGTGRGVEAVGRGAIDMERVFGVRQEVVEREHGALGQATALGAAASPQRPLARLGQKEPGAGRGDPDGDVAGRPGREADREGGRHGDAPIGMAADRGPPPVLAQRPAVTSSMP